MCCKMQTKIKRRSRSKSGSWYFGQRSWSCNNSCIFVVVLPAVDREARWRRRDDDVDAAATDATKTMWRLQEYFLMELAGWCCWSIFCFFKFLDKYWASRQRPYQHKHCDWSTAQPCTIKTYFQARKMVGKDIILTTVGDDWRCNHGWREPLLKSDSTIGESSHL